MSTIDNGGPAFPVGSGDMRDPLGMTLRDYFAAKAMQGLIAGGSTDRHQIAQGAYLVSDAMINERKPTPRNAAS